MKDASANESITVSQGGAEAHVKELPVLIEGPDTRSILQRIKDALLEVWVLFSVTTLTGIAIVVSAELWITKEYHLESILIHLGTAFIVSGIVVFGFELGSKESWLKKMIMMLVGLLFTHQKTILDASAKDAIRNSMRRLSRHADEEFADQFGQFAVAVADLKGPWSDAYLAFIAAFHKALTKKTQQLANLGGAPADTSVHVDMSDATELADVLVTKTYHLLANMEGSEYWAVSDLYTWDTLATYNEAHRQHARSLITKRLFVLGLGSDRRLHPSKVQAIILDHRKLANEARSKYQMKITTMAEYRRTKLLELAEAQHFGIFKPNGNRGAALAFLVRDEGLSNFRLMEATKPMLTEFENLWANADDLPSSNIHKGDEGSANGVAADLAVGSVHTPRDWPKPDPDPGMDAINDYVMTYLVDRMAKNSEYRGVSRLTDWINRKYDRVFKASEAAVDPAKKKNIRMRRILLLTEAERCATTAAKELKRHYSLRLRSKTRYDFRVTSHIPDELTDELPFALLDDADDDADQVVNELAQPTTGFAPASAAKRERIGAAFDELWKNCHGCTASLQNVLSEELFTQVVRDVTKRRRGDVPRRVALRWHKFRHSSHEPRSVP